MHTELWNTPTDSSGAADPTSYDAVSAAYQNARNDMLTNDVLIRGTLLESHRAGFENEKKIVKAATTPATLGGNPATPSTPSAPGGVGGQATRSSPRQHFQRCENCQRLPIYRMALRRRQS